ESRVPVSEADAEHRPDEDVREAVRRADQSAGAEEEHDCAGWIGRQCERGADERDTDDRPEHEYGGADGGRHDERRRRQEGATIDYRDTRAVALDEIGPRLDGGNGPPEASRFQIDAAARNVP